MCLNNNIHIQRTNNELSSIDLICSGTQSCMNSNILFGGSNARMNVLCSGMNSCHGTEFIADNINSLDIECGGNNACNNVIMNGLLTNNVVVQCGQNNCQNIQVSFILVYCFTHIETIYHFIGILSIDIA